MHLFIYLYFQENWLHLDLQKEDEILQHSSMYGLDQIYFVE